MTTHNVRFTRGPLGTVAHEDNSFFEDETVNKGDLGTYIGKHPSMPEEDWHLIKVIVGGRERICPCHASQFERIDSA